MNTCGARDIIRPTCRDKSTNGKDMLPRVMANVKNVSEVAAVYCATNNPLQVIVAKIEDSRSVIGIIDGASSRAIESENDKKSRSRLLRDLGYKK